LYRYIDHPLSLSLLSSFLYTTTPPAVVYLLKTGLAQIHGVVGGEVEVDEKDWLRFLMEFESV
jgi:hypothetical protein